MDFQSNTLAGCKHRRAWMIGKPPLAVLLASAPVLAANECYDLLQVNAGELLLPVSLQPEQIEEWLLLYTDHRLVARGVAETFLEKLTATLYANEDDLAAFLLGDADTVGSVDFLDDSLWRTAFERVEVRFFFRVLMPCVLLYGKSPVELLVPPENQIRQARQTWTEGVYVSKYTLFSGKHGSREEKPRRLEPVFHLPRRPPSDVA